MKTVSTLVLIFVSVCWLLTTNVPAKDTEEDFAIWLEGFREEARSSDIFPGSFPVIQPQATLAHDGRRIVYFGRELLEALHILDKGLIPPKNKMIL
ncbi:hypothetical protein DSOUD_0910 [Desulfuromonas soudanensis]|uniref:Transglycosylase SLT domain-containing protein n=1 Tax=Desulfuromonas soudanensis TaxID=1603606 RepID=A0A0M4CZY7_9BACT|nr:lytic murein transglycosylase [Desulfuromonas soudanensis]ALC15696.1 hypothetical protein DSOUD_0910 [Desulfuromonas soudanensis]